MRVCQFRHDGLDTTPAASATSAEVGPMRRPQGRSRKELHFYSTDAPISVKRTGPLAVSAAPVFQVPRRLPGEA
jgi:hypothetical protein